MLKTMERMCKFMLYIKHQLGLDTKDYGANDPPDGDAKDIVVLTVTSMLTRLVMVVLYSKHFEV